MKVETTHTRKKATIINLETGEKKTYPSIALAKYASKQIQLANGGIGAGAVRVIK